MRGAKGTMSGFGFLYGEKNHNTIMKASKLEVDSAVLLKVRRASVCDQHLPAKEAHHVNVTVLAMHHE